MKKGILLLLGMMSFATINANNIKTSTSNLGVNYRFNDAVTFIERNIKFHVFLNGDFDFDTKFKEPRYVDYYGRRTRTNRGVRIERDYRGRVKRVGNVFINYDIQGKVKRIGNVYMRYRFGQLTDIGNMQIEYDRYGYPYFYGKVKYNDYYYNDGFNVDIHIDGPIWNYDDAYFYRKHFRNNYKKYREDDNFYYYRANPNAKIGKRSKLLKRRKPTKRATRTYNKRKTNKATPLEQERETIKRNRR